MILIVETRKRLRAAGYKAAIHEKVRAPAACNVFMQIFKELPEKGVKILTFCCEEWNAGYEHRISENLARIFSEDDYFTGQFAFAERAFQNLEEVEV